ncbi:hypothetical protein [Methylovirgula sp. 4M-Z18]|uniref:hypothetical protein n=1 Tax=Methylovirgula sp. 4M-Z18 TaxID=2293567 RepID=UPI000E2ED98D|nr:hypothetical protein [Methylovirgula sp. 4M-Z18]RFB79711.1 hypothetical protein DYH55_09550 [Methylovirgula sp. 4M-Z18]
MSKPTEEAEYNFRNAQRSFTRGILNAGNDLNATDTFAGLQYIAEGLVNLATGLRATYLLLEEVNRKLDRQAARGGHL